MLLYVRSVKAFTYGLENLSLHIWLHTFSKCLWWSFLLCSFCCFSLPSFVRYCITLKVRFCMVYPCSQCLCDILVDNASIQKLLLNSTDLGDEVCLLLTLKTVPWQHMKGSLLWNNIPYESPTFLCRVQRLLRSCWRKIQACVFLNLTTIWSTILYAVNSGYFRIALLNEIN